MSIRKFEKVLTRTDYKMHYEAMINGEYSGMVTYKTQPDSWMCDLNSDDKYSNLKVDYDDFKKKNGFDNVTTIKK